MSPSSDSLKGPHRFAILLTCCIVVLITVGGLVKSLEAGLSVPDWPTSYGGFNPPRWWQIENVRAEHGHRLIAGTVALMTFFLACWLQRREERRWVKRLGWGAFAAVLLQALLGGITVLFFLPKPISISHAALAQLFFCSVVTIAVVTSARWPGEIGRPLSSQLLGLAPALPVAVFVQVLLGAIVRHTGAGLAIPDFPLAFGRLIPPLATFPVIIHYTHRLGALVVAVLGFALLAQAAQRGWEYPGIRLPALAVVALIGVQITLGALVVLTGREVTPNTFHVTGGALVLATSLVLALNSWRLGPSSARQQRSATELPQVAP